MQRPQKGATDVSVGLMRVPAQVEGKTGVDSLGNGVGVARPD